MRPEKQAQRAMPQIATPGKEPRGARRKRETRAKLLDAALKLMAEKGKDGVAINEITDAADVGFGSFYNHFESKEAIYTALTDWVFEEFADRLDDLVGSLSDPAEIIAVSIRHALLRAKKEPLWGQFLIREGFSGQALSHGLGLRLLRDIQKGIAVGRFSVVDPLLSFIAAGGTILIAIEVELQTREGDSRIVAEGLHAIGVEGKDLPERTAAMVLHILGLTSTEAREVAYRRLPRAADDIQL